MRKGWGFYFLAHWSFKSQQVLYVIIKKSYFGSLQSCFYDTLFPRVSTFALLGSLYFLTCYLFIYLLLFVNFIVVFLDTTYSFFLDSNDIRILNENDTVKYISFSFRLKRQQFWSFYLIKKLTTLFSFLCRKQKVLFL